ncbi:hypothetical protein [uncultured Brevundimonas sp.]|uniref:hypothetical protein n=1 Tax=uncultured Brevundimonas sp. TaxID=213418 RepID=UPI0026219A90|nr:hypothetical protein [uncultured Brevundimonas sp.]
MLIPLLLAAMAVAPPPSPDGAGQDGAVATAPATPLILGGAAAPVAPPVSGPQAAPHGLSTDAQIARWLAARSPAPAAPDHSPAWRDDRKPHGQVSIGVGTGGYRDYGAAVSLPLGDSGRLDISVRQSENGYPYGYSYRGGYDPYFADGGHAFAGQSAPGAAEDDEVRVSRPEGRPNRWPATRPPQAAEE